MSQMSKVFAYLVCYLLISFLAALLYFTYVNLIPFFDSSHPLLETFFMTSLNFEPILHSSPEYWCFRAFEQDYSWLRFILLPLALVKPIAILLAKMIFVWFVTEFIIDSSSRSVTDRNGKDAAPNPVG